MNKEEKAVLQACKRRFKLLMADNGFKTPADAIKAQRGKKTVAAQLIRAVAKWQMANS